MEITDDYMRDMLTQARMYTAVLLSAGPHRHDEGVSAIIWEHGRRNFELRAQGLLVVVMPVADDTPLAGIGVFNASVERTRDIMDGDPAVIAGVLTYQIHPVRGFPGDALATEAMAE